MNNFDLIIFDCDGVLVDSEPITNGVYVEMLNESGFAVTLEEIMEKFIGNSMLRNLEIIEQITGAALPEGFVENYLTRTKIALETHIKPVKDIKFVLENLKIPYCVASNGEPGKMQATLGASGLLPYFDGKLFSATEVARGKPQPDIYIYAAEQMNVAPSNRCLVIEDTPVGVTAGFAAGMTVFGFAEFVNSQKLTDAGASLTFTEMKSLPQLITNFNSDTH